MGGGGGGRRYRRDHLRSTARRKQVKSGPAQVRQGWLSVYMVDFFVWVYLFTLLNREGDECVSVNFLDIM